MKRFFPIFFLSLCGCVLPFSETVSTQCKSVIQNMKPIAVAHEQEASAAKKAEKTYLQFLRENANFQKIEFYRKQLDSEIEQIQKSDNAVLSKESAFAFTYYYRLQLEAIIDAHLGLARIAINHKNLKKALIETLTAKDWAANYSVGSYQRATELVKISAILADIYSATGETGKALNTKLDKDLFVDYMASKQGIKDHLAEKQDFLYAYEKRMELDKLITKINGARDEKNDQQALSFFKNAMQITAAYSQINSASSYGSSAFSQQFAKEMQVLNLVNTIANSQNTSSSQDFAPADFTLAGQFVNPEAGVKTRDIIRLFANTAASLSGKDEIRENADTVIKLMDEISKESQGSTGDGKIEKISHFIKVLNTLKNEVDDITATPENSNITPKQ